MEGKQKVVEEIEEEPTIKKTKSDEAAHTIKEILNRPRTFRDQDDLSIHPSYTNFKVPYHVTCHLRYLQKNLEYEKQLQKELNETIMFQPNAYEAARLQRHFSVTTLWPPLHNIKEIDYFQRNFFKLTNKQKKRLEFLRNTNII